MSNGFVMTLKPGQVLLTDSLSGKGPTALIGCWPPFTVDAMGVCNEQLCFRIYNNWRFIITVVAFVYLSEFEVFLFWTWFNRKKKMSFCSLSRCLFFNIASRLHPGFLPQSKNKHVLKWPVQGVPPSLAQQKALQGSNPPIGVYRMQWLSSRTVIGTKI